MQTEGPIVRTMDPKQIISQYRTEFAAPPTLTPADMSVDGPLMGNGDMCVAVGGDAREHGFILCKNDLWRLAHQYGKSCPVPLGQLSIAFIGLSNAGYRITQDLYSATTTGVFETPRGSVIMTSYVAATRNLLVVEIAATGRAFDARAALTVAGGRGAATQTGHDDLIFWGTRAFSTDVDVPTAAATAWTLRDDDSLDADGAFVVTPDKPVTLVLAMESVFAHDDYLTAAKAALKDLATIRESHEAWWGDYWEKSYVSIGDPLIEKQYYVSLYALGSCSRDPAFPPPIFGWTTTDNPMWAGDYHLNYNHQAPFYGLARANRLEQADPHDAPFLDFMDRAEWHCREMYGHEGGIYPVGIGPRGIETTFSSRRFIAEGPTRAEHGGLFFGQRTNGAYGLVNMAPRWYGTYDHDYGRRIYPFVLQIAAFWEHYLAWDEVHGRFIMANDSVHEGSGEDLNSCLSIGLVRNALLLALDLSRELDLDANRRDRWQHILDHLCTYTVQEREGRTVFRYTEEGADWWPGNTLGIQQVYPAGQIHLDSDPELLDVARNTIDVMQRWHDTNGSNSFFPAAVRVGYDPAKILQELRAYAGNARPNGFQDGNPHGIENLSTVPNTVNEMLCMGHGGVIRLFPVWPKDKDAWFVNIRCRGAFLVSAAISDGVVQKVTILSEKGRDCTVVNPWPGESVQVRRNGEPAEVVEGERLVLRTAADECIRIERPE